MATTTKKNRLPHRISKQLERIYSQSQKRIKQHPYKTATALLLSLGVASSIYYLMNILKK